MDDFLKWFSTKANGENMSDYTLKNMLYNVRRVERILLIPVETWDINSFRDSQNLIQNLNAKYSYNTAINTLHSVLLLIEYYGGDKGLINTYRDYLNDYIEIRTVNSKEPKEGLIKNWMPYTELRAKVMEVNEKFLSGKHAFTKFRNYLILALYTLAYPVRLGNYIGMKFLKQNEDPETLPRHFNYIIRGYDNRYTFVFNKYMTSKTLGQIIYKPDELILHRIISKYFANYSKNPQLFLVNTNNKSMSQTNLTNAISSISKSLLNKSLTLNMIRQIFITDFLKQEKTMKERKRVLKIIGQVYNPSTNELYHKL